MKTLFDNTSIGKLQLRNRMVRSATWEGLADEKGAPTAELNELMADLARNDVGLIITGHCYVSPEGQADPRQLGMHSDTMVPKLAPMPKAVHEAGGAIVLQLAHGGIYATNRATATGPSARTGSFGSAQEMTRRQIEQTVAAFASAAARAKRVGFDGVQIHAAHGFLLSEFLSPYYNNRGDEYGGSVENRARIVLEVFAAVRQAVGDKYPVLVKLNADDFVEGGLGVDDMLAVAAMLEQAGIDAIELSGGTIFDSGEYSTARQGAISPQQEGYYRQAARLFKERIDVPLILVGGLRSFDVAQEILANGEADFISLCRPLIREPDLAKRWASGDTRPAACLSCNACFGPMDEGKGFYCPLDR